LTCRFVFAKTTNDNSIIDSLQFRASLQLVAHICSKITRVPIRLLIDGRSPSSGILDDQWRHPGAAIAWRRSNGDDTILISRRPTVELASWVVWSVLGDLDEQRRCFIGSRRARLWYGSSGPPTWREGCRQSSVDFNAVHWWTQVHSNPLMSTVAIWVQL